MISEKEADEIREACFPTDRDKVMQPPTPREMSALLDALEEAMRALYVGETYIPTGNKWQVKAKELLDEWEGR